jgi:phage terminase large subunit GpA-like protein
VANSERVRATLLEAARAAAPPPDVDVVQWAESRRVLGHSSRLGGPYRVMRTPFWREPMEALSPRSGVQTVVIMKAAQMGATEFSLNCLGYYLDLAPAAILAVQPSLQMAARFSSQRLTEMLELAPALAGLTATPRGGRLPASVLFKKTTSGACLILTGANSPASLRALPARIVLLDEVDAYPGDVGGEGDPVDLAIQRAESYGTSKRILIISTPTEKGLSRVDRLYQETDRRRFYVPCPRCGEAITLEFAALRVERSQVLYRCPLCDREIAERDKLAMVEAGEWRATSACDPDTRGYHISQMYSPWTSWRGLLRRAEAAEGNPERMKVFVNTGLGECWSPPALEVPEAATLMARAEPFTEGIVPNFGSFVTCGVDVQSDRVECEIVAWGRDFESWSVAYYVITGDVTEPEVWQRLDELITRSYNHASGMPLTIQACAIDAGFSPAEVTAFTRHRHGQRVFASKGLSNGWGRAIWPRKASWDKNKHAIYGISSDEAKTFTANRLRIDAPGPGYLHFPVGRAREWYEQLVAEKLIVQKGQRKWVNPTRARNEATDCRALAVAALHSRLLAGVDLNDWCRQFTAMLAPEVIKPNGAPGVTRSRWMDF